MITYSRFTSRIVSCNLGVHNKDRSKDLPLTVPPGRSRPTVGREGGGTEPMTEGSVGVVPLTLCVLEFSIKFSLMKSIYAVSKVSKLLNTI